MERSKKPEKDTERKHEAGVAKSKLQATRRPEVDIWYGGGDEATSENGLQRTQPLVRPVPPCNVAKKCSDLKKLVVTSASLLVTSALLVVTRSH